MEDLFVQIYWQICKSATCCCTLAIYFNK